jgi:hypothetical protein
MWSFYDFNMLALAKSMLQEILRHVGDLADVASSFGSA